MKYIGITGQIGFIGSHLTRHLQLMKEEFTIVSFEDRYFEDENLLRQFVSQCDVLVHLAALNRHPNQDEIYNVNVRLVRQLISAMEATESRPHVIFSSSIQEEKDNVYGRSKVEGRKLFSSWASRTGGRFTGLIIPNVFGPFGVPFYNSVISTFSYQLTHDQIPQIKDDPELQLIYVGELVQIISSLCRRNAEAFLANEEYKVSSTKSITVSDILSKLKMFKNEYFDNSVIPGLFSEFDINLFNTFRGYIDIKEHFPVKYVINADKRGLFVELLRLKGGGQVSFSSTIPGVTRGNHYHTRKVERFSVIKGEAVVSLRRIGTPDIIELRLSGEDPSFVDMPIWYTHNIRNVGTCELFTIFWINEFYNADDPDTFMEIV